jgi:(p)ppGpp synthase/HD superfamily hydrolase
VVDFAYAVHTDVGNRCVAGRINGELMPLRTELHNGDQIEIITAAHASPNPAWLSYVRTGKARAQIRHFLKNAQQEEAVDPRRAPAQPGPAAPRPHARPGLHLRLGPLPAEFTLRHKKAS